MCTDIMCIFHIHILEFCYKIKKAGDFTKVIFVTCSMLLSNMFSSINFYANIDLIIYMLVSDMFSSINFHAIVDLIICMEQEYMYIYL